MDALAPRAAPRNLAAPLAAWLRTLGFTATEQAYGWLVLLHAHWDGPRGERYHLEYTWTSGPAADAVCRLWATYPLGGTAILFRAQRIVRLRDVRQLLLGNVRFADARVLARS